MQRSRTLSAEDNYWRTITRKGTRLNGKNSTTLSLRNSNLQCHCYWKDWQLMNLSSINRTKCIKVSKTSWLHLCISRGLTNLKCKQQTNAFRYLGRRQSSTFRCKWSMTLRSRPFLTFKKQVNAKKFLQFSLSNCVIWNRQKHLTVYT
jgi:hypothetical protein